VQGNFHYILTVNGNLPFLNVVKTREQVYDGGFPRSCRPYNGDAFPRVPLKADIVQYFAGSVIAETYILEIDVPAHKGKLHGVGNVLNRYRFRYCIENSIEV